jgi:hypothetical protein
MRPLALLCILFAAPALADDASEAKLQFELGRELYKQRRFAEAIEHFVASNRLVPNAKVVFNIAQTFGLMSRPLDAYNWYESYLAFPLDDAGRKVGAAARDALTPSVAVLDLSSSPPGAEVFLDRADLGALGQTPRRIAVAPGAHQVILRKAGWRDAEVSATAVLQKTRALSVTLEPMLGALRVETEPPGAAVKLEQGGEALGVTPLDTRAPVGTVRVVVTLEGHVEQVRSVEVRDGETVTLRLELVRAASTVAVLTVNAEPPGAHVSLDGKELGVAPLSITGLSPGAAHIAVSAPSREAWSQPIVLEPGGATRVEVKLVDPSALRWKGWRFVGYAGAVLALGGGAALGGIAVSERQAFFVNPSAERLHRIETLNLAADLTLAAGAAIAIATLIIDLATGPRPQSHGTVTVAR